MSSISSGISVIRVPTRINLQLERAKKLRKVLLKKQRLDSSRAGDKSIKIIDCKNKERNFYKGQTYDKFLPVSLASKNWNGKKSFGDYFIINQFGENPAFRNDNIEEVSSFGELGLLPEIEERFNAMGFDTPTNIQCLAIPQILKGSNTVIAAETGNGKTYAYLAPIIHNLIKWKEKGIPDLDIHNSPKVLIIVPGRELVIQTRNMARALSDPFGLEVNSIVGGRTKRLLLDARMRTPDILVASFGALSKLVTSRLYSLKRTQHIVLDEADTLLDDSFNSDIRRFLSRMPVKGGADNYEGIISDKLTGMQLTLAGATFPRDMSRILNGIVEVDSLINLKTPLLHRLPAHIKHHFYRVKYMEKVDKFLHLAKINHKNKIPTIIFSNTSSTSNFCSLFLNEHDIPCLNLNGAMPFHIRKDRFALFHSGKTNFLSTTDVGSRGLNTTWVEHVINFECPNFMSDYLHRCGRTGRVGSAKSANVSTFVSSKPDQIQLVQGIEYSIRKSCDLPNVNANIKRKFMATAEKYEELNELREMTKNEEPKGRRKNNKSER